MKNDEQEKLAKLASYLKDSYVAFLGREIGLSRSIPSQADFAKWLNVSPTSLSNWINELRPPSLANVDILANRLGIQIYHIMGLPPRIPPDNTLLFIVEKWHELSEQQKLKVEDFVRTIVEAGKV